MDYYITLFIIITSIVSFIASIIILYYNNRLDLPIGEWIVFIIISLVILSSETIKMFIPDFSYSKFALIVISVSIFVLALFNYWLILSEYDVLSKEK